MERIILALQLNYTGFKFYWYWGINDLYVSYIEQCNCKSKNLDKRKLHWSFKSFHQHHPLFSLNSIVFNKKTIYLLNIGVRSISIWRMIIKNNILKRGEGTSGNMIFYDHKWNKISILRQEFNNCFRFF